MDQRADRSRWEPDLSRVRCATLARPPTYAAAREESPWHAPGCGFDGQAIPASPFSRTKSAIGQRRPRDPSRVRWPTLASAVSDDPATVAEAGEAAVADDGVDGGDVLCVEFVPPAVALSEPHELSRP